MELLYYFRLAKGIIRDKPLFRDDSPNFNSKSFKQQHTGLCCAKKCLQNALIYFGKTQNADNIETAINNEGTNFEDFFYTIKKKNWA